MAKVQEDAEANGLEVPLIFSDIDEKSGLPKIFAPSPDIKETVMEDLLREISVKAQSLESSSQRAPILYDGTTQTDTTIWLINFLIAFPYVSKSLNQHHLLQSKNLSHIK